MFAAVTASKTLATRVEQRAGRSIATIVLAKVGAAGLVGDRFDLRDLLPHALFDRRLVVGVLILSNGGAWNCSVLAA